MRKTFATVLIAAAAVLFAAKASAGSWGHFGIIGGYTTSSISFHSFETNSISKGTVGVTYKIPVVAGFAIQPAAMFERKGMTIGSVDDAMSSYIGSVKKKVTYLHIPVQLQWGPDLVFFRPYVFVEPFFGCRISGDGNMDSIGASMPDSECGMGVGVGLELWKLQLAVRYYKNYGDMYECDSSAPSDVVSSFKGKNRYKGMSLTLGFFF